MINYPPIVAASGLTLIPRKPKTITNVLSLRGIPSQSTCEQMIDLLKGGNYSAISCRAGTFTEQSARIILNIHKLRDITSRVKEEEQWIKTEITLPNRSCSNSDDDMATYATLIFDNPDGRSVLSHNRYILASDLATIARKAWISHAILNGIKDILQMNTKHTSVFMLNDVLMIGNDDLKKYLSGKLSRSTERIVFVVNVGRTKSNQVYISSLNHPGCHWTLLYVDLKSNKWYYCDTSCWGSPPNLRGAVSFIVTAIYEVVRIPPKPFAGIVEGHVDVNGSADSTGHTCSPACLKNIPLQTCMNVCGAAVAILSAIAVEAPNLWSKVFLKRKGVLPASLKWLMSPTTHSDFLRSTLISWLIKGSVDISVIGVPAEHVNSAVRVARTSNERKNDADKREVEVKEHETIEIVDSDEGSCENVSEVQAEGDEEGSRVGDAVNVQQGETVKIVDEDEESCGNAGDGQGIGSGEGSGGGEGVHVNETGIADRGDSDDDDECSENESDGEMEDGEGDDVHDYERREGEPGDCDVDDENKDRQVVGDGGSTVESDGVHEHKRWVAEPEDYDVDDESNDKARDRQVISDGESTGESDGVHGYERGIAEPVDYDVDDECNDKARDGQVIGGGDGNGEGDGFHGYERGVVEPGESHNDDESSENASDVQMEDDGESSGGSDGVHVSHTGRADTGNSGDDDETCENKSDGQHDYAGNGDDIFNGTTCGEVDTDSTRNTTKVTEEEKCVEKEGEVFFVGRKFSRVEELETAKKIYEDSHFCELWKRDVRTLAAAAKRVPKRVANANHDLTYYSLTLTCKFGGKNVETRGKRKRKTKSFRQGCPFQVYITLSEDGKYLQVNRISRKHNHLLQKDIYERLPRQRAARNKIVAKDIEDAIKIQANPKLLKQKIKTATGKRVTLKDISNIKQNAKKDFQKNDLDDVIDYLKQQPGGRTEVVVDEENNFKGLFYQDAHMQNMYAHFPEILLVDATYKLLDLRMPVYLLVCIDGDGLSEIVAMFIVAEETKEVIQATVELFKKHNTSWDQTKVVMSDKDFTEREVFKDSFPTATLSICLYHTLRSFRREITCEKMGITSAERLRALEILSSLAHSKTSSEYETHLGELKQTNITSVIEYVMENWHPIREQWVACFKDKHLNLGETTTNRLESTFSKLKSVCSRYASLLQFCSEFTSVLQCLREERNHHYVMAITRRQTEFDHFGQDLQAYSKNLTPYAFKFVREQYEAVAKVKVLSQKSSGEFLLSGSRKSNQEAHLATITHCDCSFFTRMSLPCKHIFKVRKVVNLPAFDKTLGHKRWTMDFYLNTNRLSPDIPILHDHDAEHCVEYVATHAENKTTLTQSQKFRRGLKTAQVLASLVSEGGMSTFQRRQKVLESLIRSWKHGHEVVVQEVELPPTTKKDQKVEDPKKTVTEPQGDNHTTTEGLQEKSLPGNTEERELRTDNFPLSEAKDNVQNTKQARQLLNENTVGNLEEDNVKRNDDVRDGKNSPEFSQIKMPPKILKRGRPKGAEVTVIGLPRKKKKKEGRNNLLPFCKLSPIEKDRMILGSLSTSLAVGEAIAGHRFLTKDDILPVGKISDTVRDEEIVDIHRVAKYFEKDAWLSVLKSTKEKSRIDFVCSVCAKMINDESEDSIACDRCLLWTHFTCTSLKSRPKNRNWFCKSCRMKYS